MTAEEVFITIRVGTVCPGDSNLILWVVQPKLTIMTETQWINSKVKIACIMVFISGRRRMDWQKNHIRI